MKKIFFVFSLAFLLQASAWAASVTAVKNQKVLIDLAGASTSPGDEYFLLSPSGKKLAIIRIKQVKNNKALADILKGRAEPGFTLQARATEGSSSPDRTSEKEAEETKPAHSKNKEEESSTSRDVTYLRSLKNSFGVQGEYLMNSMTANITDNLSPPGKGTASMSGSSFGVGGFYDYVTTPDIAIQVSSFLEQYNTAGTTRLRPNGTGTPYVNSTNYSVNITYLSFYGLGKYYFTQNKYRLWAGIGGGFLVAVSKSSNTLNESNIATNQVANAAFGVDIQMNRKNYIPVSLEYTYFPPSATVSATTILLKAGWAWNDK